MGPGAGDLPLRLLPCPCFFIRLAVIEHDVATQEHGHGPAMCPLQEVGVRIWLCIPQGDLVECCQCWAHLQPVQHLLHCHRLPVCADCPHLQPVPAAPLPPAVLPGGSSQHSHPIPWLPSPMGQGLVQHQGWGTAGQAKGQGDGGAGAVGDTTVPPTLLGSTSGISVSVGPALPLAPGQDRHTKGH